MFSLSRAKRPPGKTGYELERQGGKGPRVVSCPSEAERKAEERSVGYAIARRTTPSLSSNSRRPGKEVTLYVCAKAARVAVGRGRTRSDGKYPVDLVTTALGPPSLTLLRFWWMDVRPRSRLPQVLRVRHRLRRCLSHWLVAGRGEVWDWSSRFSNGLIAILAVAFAAEMSSVSMQLGTASMSVAFIPFLAAIFLFGPFWAMTLGGAYILRRRPLDSQEALDESCFQRIQGNPVPRIGCIGLPPLWRQALSIRVRSCPHCSAVQCRRVCGGEFHCRKPCRFHCRRAYPSLRLGGGFSAVRRSTICL